MSFHDRKQEQTISFTQAMTAVKRTLSMPLEWMGHNGKTE